MRFGPAILERAEALAAITERPGMLARSYLTPQHRQAGERIRGWMREAGMQAEFDALGNVVGRYEGTNPRAPAVLTGSHMDTVVDAGKYDGLFGVLAPIACVADLHARGKRLPFPLEVVAFGDEEGVRFGTSMMGSKALAGRLDAAVLELKDAAGVTVREALAAFGGDAGALAGLRRSRDAIRLYVETHIEQGPVLLEEGLAVGVVTSIAGSSRARVGVRGEAGHAGTVPWRCGVTRSPRPARWCSRSSVIAARARAASWAPSASSRCHEGGAINVIPGDVEFTIDVRSGEDALRRAAVAAIEAAFREVAAARGVRPRVDAAAGARAAPCDPAEQERLAAAIQAHGLPVRRLAQRRGTRCDAIRRPGSDRHAVRALRQRRHQPQPARDASRSRMPRSPRRADALPGEPRMTLDTPPSSAGSRRATPMPWAFSPSS
jgi:hydantoinase/carbamoylase family amidase